MKEAIYTTNVVFGSIKLPFKSMLYSVINLQIVDNILMVECFTKLLSDTIEHSKIKKVELVNGFFTITLKEGKLIKDVVSIFPSIEPKGKVSFSYFNREPTIVETLEGFIRYSSSGSIILKFPNGIETEYHSNAPIR